MIGTGEGEVVYYDKGLDVLEFVSATSSQKFAGERTGLSAAEVGKKAELRTELPPKGLFGHTGKVLVEHEASRRSERVAEGFSSVSASKSLLALSSVLGLEPGRSFGARERPSSASLA